jgi:malate synthase
MPTPNQLDKLREDVVVGQKEMLEVHDGTRTEAGMRENIRVGVQYIEAWLRGRGAVPLYNLMEDAATAEISRSQIWQQLHVGAVFEDRQTATKALFETCLVEEMERVKGEIGEKNYAAGRFSEAIELFRTMSTADRLDPFLTLPAYRLIV